MNLRVNRSQDNWRETLFDDDVERRRRFIADVVRGASSLVDAIRIFSEESLTLLLSGRKEPQGWKPASRCAQLSIIGLLSFLADPTTSDSNSSWNTTTTPRNGSTGRQC